MLSHCLVLCLYIKVCTSLSVLSVALVGPGATAGDGIESRRPVLHSLQVVFFVDNYIFSIFLFLIFAPLLVCAIIIIIIIKALKCKPSALTTGIYRTRAVSRFNIYRRGHMEQRNIREVYHERT